MKRNRAKKQATMVVQSSFMQNLPLHILMEIISRLPIKTVMSLRCVSKSLLSLVSDYHFQTLYSTRAPSELLLHGFGKSSMTLSIAEHVFVDDPLADDVDMVESNVVCELPNFSVLADNRCNFGATGTRVFLVNSCCGLVCYKGPASNRFAVICNPFTREYVTFPCPARVDKTIANWSIFYGFGFSPKDNRFKLLRLIDRKYVDIDSGKERIRMVGEVYTFGESGSSWKTVANRPYLNQSMLVAREPIFHEGTLHWYCTSDDDMVTFDFDTELFGELETPPRTCDVRSSKARWSLAMGVPNKRLYAAGCCGNHLEMWALEEYGEESWVKVFSIRGDVDSFSYNREQFKYWYTDEVMMFKKFGGIVCFHPYIGRVKHLDGLYGRNETVFIRPTLVSLKVLLGDNVKVHSVTPWYRTEAATSSEDTDSEGCMEGSSAPRSCSEISMSTSRPIEQNVKEDVESFASKTRKLIDEIETLKGEDGRKGKAIAKSKKRKKKDNAFM